MGMQLSPTPAWDDVGPWHSDRRSGKAWGRRHPLRSLDNRVKFGESATAGVGAEGDLQPADNDSSIGYVVCVSAEGSANSLGCPQVCWVFCTEVTLRLWHEQRRRWLPDGFVSPHMLRWVFVVSVRHF